MDTDRFRRSALIVFGAHRPPLNSMSLFPLAAIASSKAARNRASTRLNSSLFGARIFLLSVCIFLLDMALTPYYSSPMIANHTRPTQRLTRAPVAAALAQILESSGLVMTHLALAAGIDRKTLYTLRNQRRVPRAGNLNAVLDALEDQLQERIAYDTGFCEAIQRLRRVLMTPQETLAEGRHS